MQTTSALYRQIIAGKHWFETSVVIGESGDLITELGERILFGGTAIIVSRGGADDGNREHRIVSVKTSMKMFDTDPTVGQAVSQEIEVSILNPPGEIPLMGVVVPYVRACNDTDVSEWIQQGVFHIDTRQVSDNNGATVLTIHGFDAMLFAEQYYQDTGLNWSSGYVPDTSMVSSIAQIMDVDVDPRTWDVMTGNYQIPFPAQYTLREILCYIASMYVGCFIMNDVGQLRLVSILEMPPETNLLIDSAGDYIVFGQDGTETLTETGNPVILEQAQAQPVEALSVDIQAVQDGTGTPSPNNIRPIHGFNKCEVTVQPSGNTYETVFPNISNNLLDVDEIEMQHSAASSIRPCFYFNGVGTFTVCAGNLVSGAKILARKYSNGSYATASGIVNNDTLSSKTYTLAEGDTLIIFDNTSSHTLEQGKQLFLDCCVNLVNGSGVMPYEPIENNTVYKGSVNFKNGTRSFACKGVQIKNLHWVYQSNNSRFYTDQVASVILKPTTVNDIPNGFMCEVFDVNAYGGYQNNQIAVAISGNIFLKCSDYTDVESLKSALGEYYIIYPLATEIEDSFTPQTISTTEGTNEISTNCGEVTVTITRPSEAVRIIV